MGENPATQEQTEQAPSILTDEQRAAITAAVEPVVRQAAVDAMVAVMPEAVRAAFTVNPNNTSTAGADHPFLGDSRGVSMTINGEPVVLRRYSSLRNFSGDNADRAAYRYGMFCLAIGASNQRAIQFCSENGIPITRAPMDSSTARASQNESQNEKGGYLVPDEFGNDMVDLRERYGVFRRNARIVPMASDSRSDPRRKSGLTAYWVGEEDAGTLSTKGWDRVGLNAKKMMVLSKYSSELNEDSVISVGDDLAGETAYAIELKTDQAGFNGDGTSTYGKITGMTQRLLSVYGTGGGVGLVLGAGNTYDELTLANHLSVVAAIPEYAEMDAKWYCSRLYYWNVMVRLMLAAGGTTPLDIMQGGRNARTFLNYPVEISQVMPKVAANSQVCCLFGSARMSASLGDRRALTIAFSEHALNAFENDEIVIRATDRLDINVHDVGDTSEAGPLVGLVTASS